MRQQALIAIIIFVGTSCGCSTNASEQTKAAGKEPDMMASPSTPIQMEKWTAEVAAHERNARELVDLLANVALDESLEGEARRHAVFLIGEIGNERAMAFLREHIAMHIPKRSHFGDADILKEYPCIFACQQGDWRHASTLIKALDRPRPRHEQMYIGVSLKELLGSDVALAILQRERKRHWTNKELQATIVGVERFAGD